MIFTGYVERKSEKTIRRTALQTLYYIFLEDREFLVTKQDFDSIQKGQKVQIHKLGDTILDCKIFNEFLNFKQKSVLDKPKEFEKDEIKTELNHQKQIELELNDSVKELKNRFKEKLAFNIGLSLLVAICLFFILDLFELRLTGNFFLSFLAATATFLLVNLPLYLKYYALQEKIIISYEDIVLDLIQSNRKMISPTTTVNRPLGNILYYLQTSRRFDEIPKELYFKLNKNDIIVVKVTKQSSTIVDIDVL